MGAEKRRSETRAGEPAIGWPEQPRKLPDPGAYRNPGDDF
jgi:hypothetical protein